MVWDQLAGQLSLANPCLLLDKHRSLIRCYRNVGGLQKSMPRPVEVHVSQLLNNNSVLTGDDQMKYSGRAYLRAMKGEG